ncbi:MAG: rRNA maturation RNase YbeY [Crocinitomicaceae bacterium]|nr:rRNA maturation RNase YbeY [Crocinitomicaceae bacterium]|tara:strand:- start:5894 stop:6325 length:432 start_codon:yes stop_codon:yes gene_type:complete
MDNQEVNFFFEDVDQNSLDRPPNNKWLKNSLLSFSQEQFSISYIFCSDDYLLKINRDFLDHDYYTDIITFNNSEENDDLLESDIFISVDRVRENAKENSMQFSDEMDRVMIHGILHLVGYNDKTNEEQEIMTQMEDKYLALRP